jgi:RNA polymerase sigma-70 factor (ECF subfamily)
VYTQITDYIIENQNKFYRLAYSYVKDKEASLDIVQNAICKALENYESIRNIQYIKTWFYKVLVNECLSYIKKYGKEILVDEDSILEAVYIEEGYSVQSNLYEFIDKLKDNVKTVIILHYYEDMTLKEIAKVTGTNINTVKTRLYSGLRKLKEYMKEGSLDDK